MQMQFGPSQTLLSSLEVSRTGDLYLPADDSFIDTAADKGLLKEVLPVARMQVVVAVAKGNPKQIKSFEDLLRKDVRLVLASTEATAVGKLTREVLTPQNLWEKLAQTSQGSRMTQYWLRILIWNTSRCQNSQRLPPKSPSAY